jgi:transposase InsO family protein
MTAPVEVRNEVIRFVHQVTGPVVGLPALRALFPDVPRCILEDLLTRYRRVWRRRYCQQGFRLTWNRPGAVWAMDHSEASRLIDGIYPYLFAVRDLGSHRQLAWLPARTEKAQEVLPVLQDLFERHGPPLVLKSDNGSAFIAEVTRAAMQRQEVAQLFSPARRPRYNGALERSNGVLKTYTQQHAAAEGHPLRWTSQDLEQARRLANTISRPWGHREPTPEEVWRDRRPITTEERHAFEQALAAQRVQARDDLGVTADGDLSAADQARVDRLALSRTLEQLGYLTKTRVTRPPKKRKRKSRQSLERALKRTRQQRGAPEPAPNGNEPISSNTNPSKDHAGDLDARMESDLLLASFALHDTMLSSFAELLPRCGMKGVE